MIDLISDCGSDLFLDSILSGTGGVTPPVLKYY